jgi:peptide/nickel transport system substrate-binding protein
LLVLAACTPPATTPRDVSPSPSPNRIATGGSVRVGLASDITGLDPWTAADGATLTVLRQVFEGLVTLEPGGLRVAPSLAESWTASSDGRVWTFRLRSGVRFHGGAPLDAAAVVFNVDRARAFARFGLDALLLRAEAPDASTVVFTLRTPYSPLLATLASGSFAIVNPVCLRQGPAWATPQSRCAEGTGPFRIAPGGWQAGDRITLSRNPTYWGADADGRSLPYIDELVFRPIRDDAMRVNELRSATVSVAMDIGTSSLATVRSDPNLTIRRRPSYDVSFIGIGTTVAPLNSADVRRAVAMAIDRGAIVQTVYGGEARSASQLVPPGLLGYDDTITEFTKYDTGAAKKLLTDAQRASGLSIELWYAPTPRSAMPDPKRIAESIAADLGKIGIGVQLRTADVATIAAMARAGTLPLWIDDRTAERADPDDFFTGVSSDAVANELLRRARGETDASKRAELYKQVTKMFQQEITRVPLFHASPPLALTRKLPGLIPQPIIGESFAEVWIGR